LDHEKEVTGIFLSGHPLDHFKFEMVHYGITQLQDFNEFRDAVLLQVNINRIFRLAGLVTDAQHRVTKTGRSFGIFTLEDFSGKSEISLWGEDYVKFSKYLEKGKNLFISGQFKTRWGKEDQYEFKVSAILLLETIKTVLTRQLVITMDARQVTEPLIHFLEKNLRSHKGKSALKINVKDPATRSKVCLMTMENGFEMNEEMLGFLQENPELEVQVVSQS
jgi:DNA polymerase-3 subunit alpha